MKEGKKVTDASIQKQGFEIYKDEERGDFTFIETREL
jgi:hypothetical protein